MPLHTTTRDCGYEPVRSGADDPEDADRPDPRAAPRGRSTAEARAQCEVAARQHRPRPRLSEAPSPSHPEGEGMSQIEIDWAAQRDAGIARAQAHAENVDPGWPDVAYGMLEQFTKERR